jgi:acetylornithine deacetylase/succinyl-diaminopimelate desuccinylase-like protein
MTDLRVARRLVLGVCASALLRPGPGARAQGGPAAPVDPAFEAVRADPRVAALLDALRADDARTFDEQKRITAIPAPPFKEAVRAEYVLGRMRELGLGDAAIDGEGNVVATRKGARGRPKLVVSAHLDTVFPEGTDVTVREKDGAYLAPGIGDDARGLGVLLSLIGALNRSGLRTVGDVVFVATVGEEELGNLRGVKALFRDHRDIDGFVSIDGLDIGRIVNQATGSHRYEMVFRGPGGHSFQEFGRPSAVHAMGRAIAKIAEVRTPADPKTTFTVGTVRGGTSVNAIAAEARLTLDMRSNSAEELLRVEERVLGLVREAVAEENRRWEAGAVEVEIKLIGDRPAGTVPEDSPVVRVARRAITAVAPGARITLAGSSTDSNVPIALGVPAVTLAGGGEGGNWHSPTEWYKPTDAHRGPQAVLLALLTLVGVDGVSRPTLPAKAPG